MSQTLLTDLVTIAHIHTPTHTAMAQRTFMQHSQRSIQCICIHFAIHSSFMVTSTNKYKYRNRKTTTHFQMKMKKLFQAFTHSWEKLCIKNLKSLTLLRFLRTHAPSGFQVLPSPRMEFGSGFEFRF